MKFNGEKLKILRIKKGMSQKDLGKLANCKSNADIYRYETGQTAPRHDRQKSIARVLGVKVEDFCDTQLKDDLSVIEVEYTKFGITQVKLDNHVMYKSKNKLNDDIGKEQATMQLPPMLAVQVAENIINSLA